MIKAEKLTFGFNGTYLFENISFTLEENCHCAMIGSNGTGKTTLLNLIREPERFIFSGKLLEGAGRLGYVSQFAIREGDQSVTVYDYLCQDFLTLENAIGEACMEMETAEDMDAVMERYQQLLDESDAVDADNHEVNIRKQLKLAELEDKADLELEKLSGGELKLVQVIRQMLRRPGLLIMDEPDVFLDFENLNGLRDLINGYSGTLLVVTHSRYLLAHCFDRIWHLENGDLLDYEGSFNEYSCSRLQKKIDLKLASIKDEAEIQRVTELVERIREDATEIIDPRLGRTLKGKVSYLNRLVTRQVKAPFVQIRQPDIRLPEVEVPEEPVELLKLAKLAAGNANLLLLDEPSSHLDTFAQIALEDAIAAYKGAVLMVSHDFYTIVNCANTILFVEDGTIRPVSARAFRKMIYKKHFSKDYLELEMLKKDLETRIQRCLEQGDCPEAQRLCNKLALTVEQMGKSL